MAKPKITPAPAREIPQQKCRVAILRFACEVRAAIQGAKSEWPHPNKARTLMLARIGAAIKDVEKELAL